MSYYKNRHGSGGKERFFGILILLSVLVIVGIGFYVKMFVIKGHVELDPTTLCPLDGSPEYVAIVFDKTDSYNLIQQQYLKKYFSEFKAQLPLAAQISLYVINDKTKENIKPDLVVCNPGKGSEANELYENPKLIQRRWESGFEKPLDEAIASMMQPSSADYSPIMEMLQIVALTAFPRDSGKSKRRLIIISDMLHHTAEWSHYRGGLDFSALKATAYYQKIRTDLHEADVQILYVRRDDAEKTQTKRHAFFWDDYIRSINGKVSLIEQIDG